MKYTKAFEKYWKNANKDVGSDFTFIRWDDMKIASFRAWKAGIKKCSAELIKPGRDEDKYNV